MLGWWNDTIGWLSSSDGQAILKGTIFPLLAILAAGITAGLIMRASMKRFVRHQDQQAKAATVAALIASARRAAKWSTLSAQDKEHVEYQASEAEVRVRLLPLVGAGQAADWAAHHIAAMKRNSANYSFQAEQDLQDLQDGLIAWQLKPSRAKKIFSQDLEAWKYVVPEDDLAAKQREWAAQQPPPAEESTPDSTHLSGYPAPSTYTSKPSATEETTRLSAQASASDTAPSPAASSDIRAADSE